MDKMRFTKEDLRNQANGVGADVPQEEDEGQLVYEKQSAKLYTENCSQKAFHLFSRACQVVLLKLSLEK